MELTSALFKTKLEKSKKNTFSKKILYFFIFRKIELSGFNSKKFFAFSNILGNVNPEKNIKVSMFQEVPF